MDGTITDPVAAAAAAAENAWAARDASASQKLGREDFLKLLLAQLENQDPLNPTQDTEFVAQLATFSSLEQLIDANQNLEGIAVGQASLINSQALNLLGNEALVESGDTIRIQQGKPDTLVYAIPRPAKSATLTIIDSDGTPVRVIELDKTSSGRVTLDWDGKDENGEALPDGEYRIEVAAFDTEGEPMAIALFQSLPIDGVTFTDTGIALISGDREIPFELIMEIRAGQTES
jgi:flagellar basal-body rod modification protein FlgD